jgi:hypothetical protein
MEPVVNNQTSWNEKPMDAIQLEKILKNMGVEEYDPIIIEQFLEIIHRSLVSLLMYRLFL